MSIAWSILIVRTLLQFGCVIKKKSYSMNAFIYGIALFYNTITYISIRIRENLTLMTITS